MKNKIELMQEIENLPLYELKEIYIENILQKNHKGIVEITKTEAISVVSKRYQLTQFKEVYLPIVENISELHGEIKFGSGKGVLLLFPSGEDFRADNDRIGLAIFNSVTREYAIICDFVVLHNDYLIMLPKQYSGMRRRHLGNVKEIMQNYEDVLIKVKENWKVISEKFNRIITNDEQEILLKNLKLGKKINKILNEKFENRNCKLWDYFIEIIKLISDKNYKNEVNKIKKLKDISNNIIKFSFLESLK